MKMQRRQLRIGELAQKLEIEKFVIRFWEKEFQLKPSRSYGGQRFYEESDIKKLTLIKELLYEKKFTIAGAKEQLKNNKKSNIENKLSIPNKIQPAQLVNKMAHIQKQLIKLKELL